MQKLNFVGGGGGGGAPLYISAPQRRVRHNATALLIDLMNCSSSVSRSSIEIDSSGATSMQAGVVGVGASVVGSVCAEAEITSST